MAHSWLARFQQNNIGKKYTTKINSKDAHFDNITTKVVVYTVLMTQQNHNIYIIFSKVFFLYYD